MTLLYVLGAVLTLALSWLGGRPRTAMDVLALVLIVTLWPAAWCMALGVMFARRAE